MKKRHFKVALFGKGVLIKKRLLSNTESTNVPMGTGTLSVSKYQGYSSNRRIWKVA